MRTPLYIGVAAVCWLIFAVKARALRRSPRNIPQRAFCISVALIAAVFTISTPPLLWRLQDATGLLAIWTTGLVVVGCATTQANFLLWTYPAPEAWPRIYRRWALCGLALIAIIALTLVGRVDPDAIDVAAYAQRPEVLWAQIPYVSDAVLLHLAVLAYTSIDASRMFWRYAGQVDRRWLQRGLRITSATMILYLLYSLTVAAIVLSVRLHFAPDAAEASAALVASVAVLTSAVGVTMPMWGPWLDRLRIYRRLAPLWRALTRATPEVVLDPEALRVTDRWKLWDVNYRLYRRVIEIRDSILELRSYRHAAVKAQAWQLAKGVGLTGEQLNATVEAAALAAAIQAKDDGHIAANPAPAEEQAGQNLADELSWFSQVADAFANSPLVTKIVAASAAAREPVTLSDSDE